MLMAGHQWGLCCAGPSRTRQCLILKPHQDSQKSCHQTSPSPGVWDSWNRSRQAEGGKCHQNQKCNKLCTLLQDEGVLCSCVSPEPPVCVLFCTGKGVFCEGLPSLDRQTAESCFDEANRCGRPLVCGFYK